MRRAWPPSSPLSRAGAAAAASSPDGFPTRTLTMSPIARLRLHALAEVDISPVIRPRTPTTARSTRSAGRSRARCTPRGPSEDGCGSVPTRHPSTSSPAPPPPPWSPPLHGPGHGAFPESAPLEHDGGRPRPMVSICAPLAGEHPQAHPRGPTGPARCRRDGEVRPRPSSFQTTSTSPFRRARRQLSSPGRSSRTPEARLW